MRDIRLAAFWQVIIDRINTPAYQTISGGANRVFKVTDDFEKVATSLPNDQPWAFTVILPPTTIWPQVAFERAPVPFLVRTECNNFTESGYNPAVTLERMQEIVYQQLQDWVPSPLTYVQAVWSLYRNIRPQTMPGWSEEDRRWWLSSEYRTEAAVVATP